MTRLLPIFVLSLATTSSFASSDSIVQLDDGSVQGRPDTSYDGREFLAFEGIPYAKPPVGELRYKSPQPVEPWNDVIVANKTYMCMQNLLFNVLGTEDCLYLNVYVPRPTITQNQSFPVIVYFHGGAFATGTPAQTGGPGKLMDRDVILVTANYRLGALGFLSLGDKIIPGNFGLKDQTLSLQWVQNNIRNFGGNPDSVTITGPSAGSASIHFHYFSPLSKGLFHRGFGQSGTALDPWALDRKPRVFADVFLDKVGCVFEDSEAALRCLQEAPANELVSAYGQLYKETFHLPLTPFAPVIEEESESAFLSEEPLRMMDNKNFYDAPLLLSVTTEEGIFPSIVKAKELEDLNRNWRKWAPFLLNYYHFDQEEQDSLSAQIKQDYFKNGDITTDNFNILIDLCTTRLFHWGSQNTTLLQGSSSRSPVYFFKMGYGPENSIYEQIYNISLPGVAHGDDAVFYYDLQFTSGRLNEEEERMKNILLDMVFSFVSTDVPVIPNVDWKPVTQEDELTYLLVRGPEEMKIVTEAVDADYLYGRGRKQAKN